MNVPNLMKAVRHLMEVPEKQWNMNLYWFVKSDGSCQGCAMGHLAHDNVFEGLRLLADTSDCPRMPVYEGKGYAYCASIADKLFEATDLHDRLFHALRYEEQTAITNEGVTHKEIFFERLKCVCSTYNINYEELLGLKVLV